MEGHVAKRQRVELLLGILNWKARQLTQSFTARSAFRHLRTNLQALSKMSVHENLDFRVAAVRMWGTSELEGVQFIYENRMLKKIVPGERVGTAATRDAPPTVDVRLVPDEYITDVSGQQGDFVLALCLRTNLGRVIQCGGGGGNPFSVELASGVQVRQVQFDVAETLSNAIVFYNSAPEVLGDARVAFHAFIGRNVNYRVAIVRMWGASRLSGLQLCYERIGMPGDTIDGPVSGRVLEDDPSALVEVVLEEEECIAGVFGRKSDGIDSFSIRTTFDRVITCGGKSGSLFANRIPDDLQIRSIRFTGEGDRLEKTSVTCGPTRNNPEAKAAFLQRVIESGEYRVMKVRLWGDEFADGYQFIYCHIRRPEVVSGPMCGVERAHSKEATMREYMLHPQESITEVSGRHSTFTGLLCLSTNFNRYFQCGDTTEGVWFSLPASDGQEYREMKPNFNEGHLSALQPVTYSIAREVDAAVNAKTAFLNRVQKSGLYRVTKVNMWGNVYLDAVQMWYASKANAYEIIYGPIQQSHYAEGSPDVQQYLAEDERIVAVHGRSGAWMDKLSLVTNKDRTISCGGEGGAPFVVQVPSSSEFLSLAFSAGERLTTPRIACRQEDGPVQTLAQLLKNAQVSGGGNRMARPPQPRRRRPAVRRGGPRQAGHDQHRRQPRRQPQRQAGGRRPQQAQRAPSDASPAAGDGQTNRPKSAPAMGEHSQGEQDPKSKQGGKGNKTSGGTKQKNSKKSVSCEPDEEEEPTFTDEELVKDDEGLTDDEDDVFTDDDDVATDDSDAESDIYDWEEAMEEELDVEGFVLNENGDVVAVFDGDQADVPIEEISQSSNKGRQTTANNGYAAFSSTDHHDSARALNVSSDEHGTIETDAYDDGSGDHAHTTEETYTDEYAEFQGDTGDEEYGHAAMDDASQYQNVVYDEGYYCEDQNNDVYDEQPAQYHEEVSAPEYEESQPIYYQPQPEPKQRGKVKSFFNSMFSSAVDEFANIAVAVVASAAQANYNGGGYNNYGGGYDNGAGYDGYDGNDGGYDENGGYGGNDYGGYGDNGYQQDCNDYSPSYQQDGEYY